MAISPVAYFNKVLVHYLVRNTAHPSKSLTRMRERTTTHPAAPDGAGSQQYVPIKPSTEYSTTKRENYPFFPDEPQPALCDASLSTM